MLNMRSYIIITPAKNEEKHIESTLKSICKQTLLPLKWIIVDDGSTDNTSGIIEKYTKDYYWIKLITTETEKEKRSGGSKVVRAFNIGFNALPNLDYDFIVKLDADLILPSDYFEKIAKCFEEDAKVGLCGGYCVIQKNGKFIKEKGIKEKNAPHSVRGAFKAYRRKAFKEIGGLKPVWHWDGLDQMALRQKGWQVKLLPLEVIHLRPTSHEYNAIQHRFKSGREYYKDGHSFGCGILRAILYSLQKPYIISGVIFFIGFIKASLSREEKNVDRALEKFIRKFQYERLLKALKNKMRYV